MAGLSDYLEPIVLDYVFNNTAPAAVAAVWIQLHTADPTDVGTTAIATENTRKSCSFSAATGGAITTDALLEWVSVAGTEQYTFFSLWTLATGGSCLWTGTVTANSVTAGDTFQIAAGDLDITLD